MRDMTTQPEESEESIAIVTEMRDKLLEFIEASERASEAHNSRFDALHDFVKAVDARVDAHGDFVGAVSKTQTATNDVVEKTNDVVEIMKQGLDTWMTKLDSFEVKVDGLQSMLEGLETKFDGVRDDLALVKGGHARSAMVHNLPRIADEFGFQFIAAMPQTTIIEFAKMAKALGEEGGQIASFKNADMVMHVLDDKGQPAYVAIEASFTVDSNDVTRALRNAGYLTQFTGLPAFPAVAGVAVMAEAEAEVATAGVFLYKISPGELQSE